DDMGDNASRNHFMSELRRVPLPKRKETAHSGCLELSFAVGTDVLEKEVAKDDMSNLLGAQLGECLSHSSFVHVVWAWTRYWNLGRRQAKRCDLSIQQGAPHAVHSHPVVPRIDGGHDTGNVREPKTPRLEDREGAVLPRTPRHISGWWHGLYSGDVTWRVDTQTLVSDNVAARLDNVRWTRRADATKHASTSTNRLPDRRDHGDALFAGRTGPHCRS